MKLEDAIKQKKFKTEDEKLVINLMYTTGWMEAEQLRFFKRFGISSQQYNVLRILRGQACNPASVSLIQDRMLDKMSNASRLIEKLKQKGLVERKECSKDRRQVDVVITAEGSELLARIDGMDKELHGFCGHLELSEKQLLNNLLDKLRTISHDN